MWPCFSSFLPPWCVSPGLKHAPQVPRFARFVDPHWAALQVHYNINVHGVFFILMYAGTCKYLLYNSVHRGLIFFSVLQNTHSMPTNRIPLKNPYPFHFWMTTNQNIPHGFKLRTAQTKYWPFQPISALHFETHDLIQFLYILKHVTLLHSLMFWNAWRYYIPLHFETRDLIALPLHFERCDPIVFPYILKGVTILLCFAFWNAWPYCIPFHFERCDPITFPYILKGVTILHCGTFWNMWSYCIPLHFQTLSIPAQFQSYFMRCLRRQWIALDIPVILSHSDPAQTKYWPLQCIPSVSASLLWVVVLRLHHPHHPRCESEALG
jgi:hypothetical protein